MDMMKHQIFSYLKNQRSPVGLKRLERILKLPAGERSYLKVLLKDMVREGQLIRTRDGLYAVSGGGSRMPSLPYRSIRDASVGHTDAGPSYRDSRSGKNWQLHWPAEMCGQVESGDRVLLLDSGSHRGLVLGVVERSPCRLSSVTGQQTTHTGPTDWHRALMEAFTLFSPWKDTLDFKPDPEEMKGRVNICHLRVYRLCDREKQSPLMISCEPHPDRSTLGFHLLDITAAIRTGAELDISALLRGTSARLSATDSTLLPQLSSTDTLPTISLFFDMRRDGALSPWRIELSMVQPQPDPFIAAGASWSPEDIAALSPVKQVLKPASGSTRDWLTAASAFMNTTLTRVMLERGINGLQWRNDGETPDYLAFHKGNRYRHAPVRFTNPINRYADMVNQRMLKAWLRREPAPYAMGQLEMLATACSWREAVTAKAENGFRLMNQVEQLISEQQEQVTVTFTGRNEQGYSCALGADPVAGIVPVHRVSGRTASIGSSCEIPVSWIQPMLSPPKLPLLDLRL